MSKKIESYRVAKILGLSYHARIALFGMVFIVIPAIIMYFVLGKDVPTVYEAYSKNFTWWHLTLITLGTWVLLMFLAFLFIKVFRWFGFEAYNFFVPLSLVMLSFTVTSGLNDLWFVRLLVVAVLFLTIPPVVLLNRKLATKQLKAKKQYDEEQRRKNRSLLD
ncbi:hypothetical protein ACWXVL_00375 [Mycoplasma sp. 128]